jgi:hypothetical protein
MGILDGLVLMVGGVGSMVQLRAGMVKAAGQEQFYLEYGGDHVYSRSGHIQIGKG